MVKRLLIAIAFLLPVFVLAQIDYNKQIKNIPPGLTQSLNRGDRQIFLVNSDFEGTSILPPPGWTAVASPTLSYETSTQAPNKTQSLKVVSSGTNSGVQYNIVFPIIGGDTYSLQCASKSDGTAHAQCFLGFYDKTGASLLGQINTDTVSTSWVTQVVFGTVPATAVQAKLFLFNTTTTGTEWFDQISLQKTNFPASVSENSLHIQALASGVLSGTDIVSLTPASNSFLNFTSIKNWSNTRVVDGTSYLCSDVGINAAVTDVIAANANGGTIYVSCPGTNTIASTVSVGSASAHIQMIFLNQSIWNCTFVNAANDCWDLYPNSSMEGAAHGVNQQQFTISAAASVKSIIKTFSHITPTVATHFKMNNIEVHNQSSGTIANAVVELQGAYDSSFINLSVDNFTGRGLWIHDFTSPAGGNSLAFYNLLLDGGHKAGARPLVIEQNNGSGSNGSAFHFFGGDWGHPGTGQFLVEINGHGTSAFGQISIENVYMESNSTDTTTALIKVADVSQVNFTNVRLTRLSASSTADGIAVSETAANLTGNIGGKNISANGGTGCNNTNIVNNSVAGAGTGAIKTSSCGLDDYSFLSSELGDQSQVGNQWYFPNGSSLFGNVSGARTNAITPNFPVQIYQNANTVTAMDFFQNTVSSWRVGMPANSNAFCFGQNDTLTSCPIAWSTTGILNEAGLQIFNTTTTCTTGASVGSTCTTANITLPVTEPDTSYRIWCDPHGFAAGVPVFLATTIVSTSQFTISIAALTAVGASFSSYDCLVGHN